MIFVCKDTYNLPCAKSHCFFPSPASNHFSLQHPQSVRVLILSSFTDPFMFCGWDGREPVEFPMSNYRVKIIITELVTLGHGHGRRGGVLLL